MSLKSKSRRFFRRLRKAPQELYERLSRWGRRLAAPFEEFSQSSVEKVSTLAEAFNKLESRAARAGKGWLRPFQFVARLPKLLLYAVVSPRRLAAWTRPLRHAAQRVGKALAWLAEALFIDRFFVRLAKLTKPLWYPLAAWGGFVGIWWRTRKLKRLWWGIPLLVLLLPLLLVGGWRVFGGRSAIAANYQAAITDARAAKDYARLQLFERKLIQLGIDTRRTDFNTVLALERDGRLAEAYRRAQLLASGEDLGYAPAHLWIVEHLLAKKLDVTEDAARPLIQQHLAALVNSGMKGRQITMLEGLALVQQQRLREAAAVFRPLVDQVPLAAIQRFQIDLALKDRTEARRDAIAVRQHLDRQRRGGTALGPDDYQCWAKAEEYLNERARHQAVLREWLQVAPDNAQARQALSQLQIQAFVENLVSPQPDAALLASRLEEAFALGAVSEDFKLGLVGLYHQKQASPILQSLFDQLAQANDLSAALAELLGTVAGVDGELPRAEAWTRQAIRKNARSGNAWNNLACILLQKNDPQLLNEGLAAAERAVALAGDDYRFRETRGQILLRLRRPQEAVRDLEFALNGMPQAVALHRTLATAYDALGNNELAAQHRQLGQ